MHLRVALTRTPKRATLNAISVTLFVVVISVGGAFCRRCFCDEARVASAISFENAMGAFRCVATRMGHSGQEKEMPHKLEWDGFHELPNRPDVRLFIQTDGTWLHGPRFVTVVRVTSTNTVSQWEAYLFDQRHQACWRMGTDTYDKPVPFSFVRGYENCALDDLLQRYGAVRHDR